MSMNAFNFDVSDDAPDAEDTSDWNGVQDYLEPDAPEMPEDDSDNVVVDAAFIKQPTRPRGAVGYQRRIHRAVFKPAFELTAQHPDTIADSAAIIVYGPKLTAKIGDLAATDTRVASMVNFLDEGTSNPLGAALVAALPLVMQLIRNHEPVLEPAPRGFKIPFLKHRDGTPRRFELKWKVGIKLGKLRNRTYDPVQLENFVFDNPDIKAQLAKRKLIIGRSNGGRKRGTQRDDAS
jgi:hypothetical protein